MKQTAVEWLEEQYTKQITFLHREDFEQVKEIERQQIIDAYDVKWIENIKDGKDYYKEIFKNK